MSESSYVKTLTIFLCVLLITRLLKVYTYFTIEHTGSVMSCLVKKCHRDVKSECKNFPVPNYLRTRKVRIEQVSVGDFSHVLIRCDCNYFTREKCPCRHFYALVNRTPIWEDFSPEHFQSYELFYGEEGREEYTRAASEMIQMMELHGGLLLKMTLAQFVRIMKRPQDGYDLTFFQCTENDLGLDTTLRFGTYIHDRTPHSSDALAIMANPKKQKPYQLALKPYKECAYAAKSEEDVDELIGTLVQLKAKFIRGRSQQNQGRQFHDFPHQEKRTKVQRGGL